MVASTAGTVEAAVNTVGPFHRSVWESEAAGVDYYRLPEPLTGPLRQSITQVPPVSELAPGTYTFLGYRNRWGARCDYVALGYTYVHDLVTLSCPVQSPTDLWAPNGKSPFDLAVIEGRERLDLGRYLRDWAPAIFGKPGLNRFYRTLPREKADLLMQLWVWNSCLDRGTYPAGGGIWRGRAAGGVPDPDPHRNGRADRAPGGPAHSPGTEARRLARPVCAEDQRRRGADGPHRVRQCPCPGGLQESRIPGDKTRPALVGGSPGAR